MKWIEKALRGVRELLYPPRCLCCGDPAGSRLCASCRAQLDAEKRVPCPACGKEALYCRCEIPFLQTLPTGCFPAESFSAENFSAESFSAENFSAAARFYTPDASFAGCALTRALILRCKSAGNDELSDLLMRESAFRVAEFFRKTGENRAEWSVTWIPRSPENLLKYGFDHGELLAASLARFLEIPCVATLFRGGGKVQKELSVGERRDNAASSLFPRKSGIEAGRKYILVDDVITTGASMKAAAHILLQRGAAAILPVAAAKTMPRSHDGASSE